MSNLLVLVAGVGHIPEAVAIASSTAAPDSLVAATTVDQPQAITSANVHVKPSVADHASESDAPRRTSDTENVPAVSILSSGSDTVNIGDESSSAEALASASSLSATEVSAASSWAEESAP